MTDKLLMMNARSVRERVECAWCFGLFLQVKAGQRWCSQRCRDASWSHRHQFGCESSTPLRFCSCGLPVAHDLGARRRYRPRGVFCVECRVRYEREIDRMRGSHRALLRRTAVKAGEKFTVDDLRERDGDLCYLCGELMVFDKSGLLRNRVSVDHVVPLVKGGAHSLENCKLAHYGCNASKGGR